MALVSLMHIIDHPRPPISLNKNQVQLLTTKVAFLQGFLQGYNINAGYTTEADPLESRIASAAYAAEDLIESYIVDNIPNQWKKTLGLYQGLKKVIQDMATIEKEAMEIEEMLGVQHQLLLRDSATGMPSSIRLVGVDNVLLEMMDKLTGGQIHLQIIPIVGMGGIGKTALATNVFQAPLIQEHFDIQEHLKDLISRNLILIHDFCLREAEKERFYNVGTPQTTRRIVISSASKKEAVDALQSMSLARSLIWNREELPWLRFRLLRILDVFAHRSTKVAQHIQNMLELELVNSRYVAITILWEWEFKLPSSIYLFWNLQTLIVDDVEGIVVPAEIWYMPQIRNVKFRGLSLPDPPSDHQDNIVLGNLQTMVTIKNFKCSEEMVQEIASILFKS